MDLRKEMWNLQMVFCAEEESQTHVCSQWWQLSEPRRNIHYLVCHMKEKIRGSVERPEKLGFAIPSHRVSARCFWISTEDQTWMSGVCSFTHHLRQASCCHVTRPMAGEDDKGRSQVTSITLSPAPAILTVSLFSPHNWPLQAPLWLLCFSLLSSLASLPENADFNVDIPWVCPMTFICPHFTYPPWTSSSVPIAPVVISIHDGSKMKSTSL